MQIHLRKKRLKDGRDSLYLDIYNDGKRHYEFLKLYVKRGAPESKEVMGLAKKIQAQRLIDLSNKEYGQISAQKKKASFIKYFQNHIKDRHKWGGHYGTLRHLLIFTKNKDVIFKQITKEWLDGFSNYLTVEAKLMPNTSFKYFRILKGVLLQASKGGFIRLEIIRSAEKLKRGKTEREFLEESELRKLASSDFFSSEVKRAFLFSCFTGLRQSDVRNLRWSDIKNNTIKIKMQKVGDSVEVPLNKTALSLIKPDNIHYLPEAKVFQLMKDRSTINRHLTRWFKEVGIEKKAYYHLSRHTFATLNISSGNDLYVVSKLLGHKNIKTTEIYSKVIDAKKKEAVDNLPEIEVNL